MSTSPTLDPVRTAEIIYQGATLWRAQHEDPPELQDIIWRLIEDAVETQKSLTAGRPRSAGTSWPDIVMTAGEIIGAYNDGYAETTRALKEGREPPDLYRGADRRAQPSAQALGRYLDVMGWLRYMRCRTNKRRRIELVLALAGGLSPTRASVVFGDLGLGSRHAVLAAKYRAIANIEEKIRDACPKLIAAA